MHLPNVLLSNCKRYYLYNIRYLQLVIVAFSSDIVATCTNRYSSRDHSNIIITSNLLSHSFLASPTIFEMKVQRNVWIIQNSCNEFHFFYLLCVPLTVLQNLKTRRFLSSSWCCILDGLHKPIKPVPSNRAKLLRSRLKRRLDCENVPNLFQYELFWIIRVWFCRVLTR